MNINFRGQRLIPGYDFLQPQMDNKPVKVLVHEFIQSVVFTPFPQDSELQVERLVLAGNIYESIGFKRKAAFYRRFAALKSVTVQSNWQECYNSLLNSIEGFGLMLDPVEYENSLAHKCGSVWPGLHVQLIEELITCCKKIKSTQAGTLAIRHMSFLLHTFESHLTDGKKRETAQDLEEFSTNFGEDSPVPLKLDSGHIIPSVNLTKYPLCLEVKLDPLPIPLRPMRLTSLSPTLQSKESPFIFTPLMNHKSSSMFETNQCTNALNDVVWVQDEPCTTTMVMMNTLPFQLNVTSIKLLTDGVPLETSSTSFTLDSIPNHQAAIKLIGIPRQVKKSSDDSTHVIPNRLEIFGYSTHLLGVKSNCRFDMIPKSRLSNQIVVEICPPMPKIEFQFPTSGADLVVTHIPQERVRQDFVILEVQLNRSIDADLGLVLTILNTGNADLQYLLVRGKQLGVSQAKEKFIRLDEEVLERVNSSGLKIGDKVEVPLHIDSELESCVEQNDHVTTILEFEYSGGLALKERFCRKCSIKLMVKLIKPEKSVAGVE